MNRDDPPAPSRRLGVYTLLVPLAAVVVAALRTHDAPIVITPLLLFLAGLALLAELLPVQLPGGGRVSVGSAINFAAIIAFGVTEAMLIGAFALGVANVVQRRANRALFNAGQIALTVFVSGCAWVLLGGTSPNTGLAADVLPGLATVGVYLVANSGLVIGWLSLQSGKPFAEVWAVNVRWALPSNLALGCFGFLIATILTGPLGIPGVILLWMPLIVARYSFKLYTEVRTAHLETVRALASALEARDSYTYGHSQRVSELARRLAEVCKLPANQIEQVRCAGLLHDIGKIGIRDSVLFKLERLTDQEFDIVRKHPVIGANMLQPIQFLRGVEELVRAHHERWDGRGYPEGLTGERIPTGARILAIADAYDAMNSDRIYRSGIGADASVDELKRGAGSQFDPKLIERFIADVLGVSGEKPLPSRLASGA